MLCELFIFDSYCSDLNNTNRKSPSNLYSWKYQTCHNEWRDDKVFEKFRHIKININIAGTVTRC